ncbi:amidase [Paracraurococcus ruber]|uniref:Asp-tRNA(Asn)/Glu-tRNA(Gln) amidotransferase GatCAB subunit A n=1 Tax=Paracraurococcus ruber TaxID=77675 RepID=A0ABS1D3A4_9PROT|nr:amidase [Paracraurococcus ruber]MBK1660572.1 Asp-tRNA(Asn)/Glu-tRNA(Gln) amidotransferase GatCAB subunit A [Paracraurococcus ruber]TDG29297.1 amidase [Paracraurococcus ruber]
MSDLTTLSMTEAADAFARGEVTAEAMVRASLARIEAHDGKVNSVIRLDRDAALDQAAAQDKARAAGQAPGKLAGAPMMHKDMYYRAGKVSSCGSKIRKDFVPKVTATVLQRLDAAGAIDMGTLNMAEFAQNPTGHNAHFGDCHNPWNPAYCTGGSSSGSGAAVAARFVTAALGSDTGGSIRLPATLCGVTGLKATQTRVSRHGVMPLSFSCDNVGPLVRTARDAARFLAVTAGHDPKDPTSAPEAVPDYEAALTGHAKGLKVAVCETYFLDGADAPVVAGFEAALAALREAGAEVTRVKAPSLRAINAYVALVSRVEGATIHANWMREHPGDYAIHLSSRLYGGYAIPGHLYVEALSRRGALLRQFVAETLTGFDVVATPTLRTRVPTLAETDIDADPANWARFMAVSANTRPFNYLGLPTVSIPCGLDDRGLPIGLQLAARPFAEATLLRAADAFQQVTDWHRKAPAL